MYFHRVHVHRVPCHWSGIVHVASQAINLLALRPRLRVGTLAEKFLPVEVINVQKG